MSSSPAITEINPYAAPLCGDAPLGWPVLPSELWPLVDIRANVSFRNPWSRRLILTGNALEDLELHYNTLAVGEVVYVNGRLVARAKELWPIAWISPRVDFNLPGLQYLIPATIETKASFSFRTFYRISKFCLIVAGKSVYEEGP